MVIPSPDVVIGRVGPSPGEFGPYLNATVSAILAAFDDRAGSPSPSRRIETHGRDAR